MLNGVVGFQVKIMTLDPDMNLTVYCAQLFVCKKYVHFVCMDGTVAHTVNQNFL